MSRILRSALLLTCILSAFALAQTSAPTTSAKTPAKAATTKKAAPAKSAETAKPPAAKTDTDTAKAPDTIILKGAPMGGVKFMHTAHSKDRGIKCETCHHAAKPDSPTGVNLQRCTDCHTAVAKAPMKTKRQAAFHNPTAKAGICIDCHLAENAKGKKAPNKCAECHQKANA